MRAPPHSRRDLPADIHWAKLVWAGVRPRLIHLAQDFLIFIALWLLLAVAHWLTTFLPLDSPVATAIRYCHETSAFLSFLAFSLIALYDLLEPHLRR